MSLLAIDHLRVCYGPTVAVDDVSLTVAAGEIVAIIGPNGAGKSTFFNAINGQRAPSAGTVRLDGRDIVGLSPERIFRLGVGRTFQITATVSSMTVRENIQMALISHHGRLQTFWRTARGLYREAADALLASVGMADQADRACGVLAYGDLKRLELAIALANEPRLLLMDEPTAGMAPTERIALMALTAELAHARNISVLFTEHDMDVVFTHADRIIVLCYGEIIAQGRPADVRADPEVRRVYLGTGTGH
jgi:branched-chain amino acid transport system ATP-binding protein